MAINPENFYLYNITDTSAVWNIISSLLLFSRAKESGVHFYCTDFVIYECLYKKRKVIGKNDIERQTRLKKAMEQGSFQTFRLDLDDLQQIAALESRKSLGKGELSSIAFAMKTHQAFLNDDKKARELAGLMMQGGMVQTTPHLLSWLIFTGKISDSEKHVVIDEHQKAGCNLAPHLEVAYIEGCRCRAIANHFTSKANNPPIS